ncbi:hypothetical protein SUDANB5_00140 [Streptomyces sp. SudanB5_2050]
MSGARALVATAPPKRGLWPASHLCKPAGHLRRRWSSSLGRGGDREMVTRPAPVCDAAMSMRGFYGGQVAEMR